MMIELPMLTHWTWWAAGALLVVLEVFAAGAFFLWMGVSAGAVGVIAWFAPSLAWEIQLVLFAVFSLAAIFLSRKYLQQNKKAQSSLSARGKHYLGMVVTVEDAIVNGAGKVRVEDTVWRAQGADAAAGRRVKIVGVSGATFQVETLH
ncbi:MAG: NfeD family protein [Gammaproteobacteria bacterium]